MVFWEKSGSPRQARLARFLPKKHGPPRFFLGSPIFLGLARFRGKLPPKMAKNVTGVPPKIPKNLKNGQKRPHRAPRNCTKKSKNRLKMSKRGLKKLPRWRPVFGDNSPLNRASPKKSGEPKKNRVGEPDFSQKPRPDPIFCRARPIFLLASPV